jgi:hypothetical protein
MFPETVPCISNPVYSSQFVPYSFQNEYLHLYTKITSYLPLFLEILFGYMPFFKIPFVPVGICFSKNESYVAIRRNSLRNAIEEKKCSNMQKKGMLAFLYFAPL